MTKQGLARLLAAITTLLCPLVLPAQWFGGEFSAQIMTLDVKRQTWELRSTIYVGAQQMRMELRRGGKPIVNILDPKGGFMYALSPAQRIYLQAPMPVEGRIPMLARVALPDDAGSPCRQAGIRCTRLGEEEMDGVRTEKWAIADERDPRITYNNLLWLDPTRHMAIRIEEPGQRITQLRYRGAHTIAHRPVEKWETVVTAQGETQRTVSYIDPVLHLVVRLETGKEIIALTNIRQGAQPSSLFQVPPDYRRMSTERQAAEREAEAAARAR
jgi:hypothetical protein